MNAAKSKEILSRDFARLVADAKALLDNTTGELDDKAKLARQKLADSLKAAEEAYGEVEDKVREQAGTVDHFVQDHPYQIMGGLFVFGLMLGWITGRK